MIENIRKGENKLDFSKFVFVDQWKMKVRIGDLTKIRTGKLDANAASMDGQYPFFTCSKEPLRISTYSYDCECVLVAGNGDLNVKYYNGKFDAYQRTYIIENNNVEKLYLPYLYYFLETYIEELRKQAIGGVIKYIKICNLSDAVIELPSIAKQKKIVKILKSSKKCLDMRNTQMAVLDGLIKARFVEMFGDLNINDKGWREISLFDACNKLKRYPTFCNMEYLAQGVRVIRISNILMDGHMDVDDENYVFVYDGANIDFPDTVIELQDIVMAVRGDGSAAKRIGIIQEEKLVGANISPNLIRIQAKREIIEPVWLFYYLTSEVGQKRLDAYVNKTAKKNIAAKDIAKIVTPVPDLNKQKQYVDFANQVDKSKVVVQKALDEAQLLFDSLMQKYFG